MNIVHMVNIGVGGGQLRVALEQARHLQCEGHQSLLIAGFPIPSPYKYDDVEVRYKINLHFPKLLQGFLVPIMREISGAIGSLKLPKDYQPDWIVCHSLGLIHDALEMKHKTGCKVAVLIHAITYPPSLLNFLTGLPLIRKRQLKRATKLMNEVDLIISTSRVTQKFVRDTYDVESEILYLGCSPASKIPAKRGDFVLCAQRMSIRKKVDLAARVISLIDKDIKVIFAGESHRTSRLLINKIRKIGLKNYEIRLDLTDEELTNLYLTCRVLLYINKEPFGMNQMEAASNGAPVVANAGSGASELFTNGLHGFFIKDKSGKPPLDEYAERVRELVDNERLAWKMGRAAWKLCKKEYTWKKHILRLLKLFDKYS